MKTTKWLKGHDIYKVSRALLMLEHAPVPHVSRFTGIDIEILKHGAKLMNKEEWLNDTGKPELIPSDFYDNVDIFPEDVAESSAETLQNALNRIQGACGHEKFFCRCSRCMKVLGSEVTHFHYEELFKMLLDLEYDLRDVADDRPNDIRHEFALALSDRLYKKVMQNVDETDTIEAEI